MWCFNLETILPDRHAKCPICIENCNDQYVVFMKCLHLVHTHCLYDYILNNPKSHKPICMICRNEIESIYVDDKHYKNLSVFLLNRLKKKARYINLFIKYISSKKFSTRSKRLEIELLNYLDTVSKQHPFMDKNKILMIVSSIMTNPIVLRKLRFIETDIFYIMT